MNDSPNVSVPHGLAVSDAEFELRQRMVAYKVARKVFEEYVERYKVQVGHPGFLDWLDEKENE